MAFRYPLILDGSNNLKEMTAAQVTAVSDRVRYLYGANPSVTLSRVASGGNLGTITDTRKISGASSTSTGNQNTVDDGAAEYTQEAGTAEPGSTTVNYARITQTKDDTTASVDTNNIAFPIYRNADSNIRAMSLDDVIDTFINPAIDAITGNSQPQPGTYYIHTATSLSGYSAVSTSPVFSDTRADVGSFLAANIGIGGTTQDFATTVTNYYLLSANNMAAPSMEQMLFIRNSDKNIEQYTQAEMDAWLQNCVRHTASEGSGTGTRITYNYTTGTNLGSGMNDTILNGSGNYQTRFVGVDDYRAQEFPNGSSTTSQTHRLKITQV
jgi:hypothetical protein